MQAQLTANHHENRTRTNAKSKSLLAGLIYDNAGNRLVSSHATKNGKRYRYYIASQGTRRSAATLDPAKLRLPATMIDELLRAKLQSFLTDKPRYQSCFVKRDVGRLRLAAVLRPQARLRIR